MICWFYGDRHFHTAVQFLPSNCVLGSSFCQSGIEETEEVPLTRNHDAHSSSVTLDFSSGRHDTLLPKFATACFRRHFGRACHRRSSSRSNWDPHISSRSLDCCLMAVTAIAEILYAQEERDACYSNPVGNLNRLGSADVRNVKQRAVHRASPKTELLQSLLDICKYSWLFQHHLEIDFKIGSKTREEPMTHQTRIISGVMTSLVTFNNATEGLFMKEDIGFVGLPGLM